MQFKDTNNIVKQITDNQMGILTCFPPFQIREAMFSITDDGKTPFASIIDGFRRLQISLADDNNKLTLQWCTEAVALLKKMHSKLLALFENSRYNLLDEYMNESLSIMELCNLLKSATSDVNTYCLMINLAAKDMQNNGENSLQEIQKLEFDSSKIKGIQRWENINTHNKLTIYKHKCRDSSISNIVYALRSAMTTIYQILLYAVCHHIPLKHDKFSCLAPEIKPFMVCVKDFTSCFEKKCQILPGESLRVAFLEYVLTEKAIDEIKSQLNNGMAADKKKLQRSRSLIEQKSMALKAGLEAFESEINQLFEDALRGRNKLLQMIMKNDAT